MANAKRGKDEPTVIKKYANRRLYDTGRSSYVTLQDLSEMLRDGYEFVVYDAKSGEDITRSVLAQIIADKESGEGSENLMPTGFMQKLIGLYGDSTQPFVPNYLESTMDLFMKNQERMREQMTKSLGNMNPLASNPLSQTMKGMFGMPPALEEMNRQNMAMFERTMKMFTPFAMPGSPSGANQSKEEKIRNLKKSIAEIEQEISRLAAE